MEQTTLFLSLNTKVKVNKEVIVLKDIAKIYCLDSAVSQRINEMEIYRFKKQDEGRCVITVLKVISLIQKIIDFHKSKIEKLEEKKFLLTLDFQNAVFEEKQNQGQFTNRFEISARELRTHTD